MLTLCCVLKGEEREGGIEPEIQEPDSMMALKYLILGNGLYRD